MSYKNDLTKTNLRTPKAAAIAGILFSVLLIVALWLLRISIPAGSLAPNIWLRDQAKVITFALGLIPLAGIAFLWFIGVLRDRLGQREDRFFATVFLGSGLCSLRCSFRPPQWRAQSSQLLPPHPIYRSTPRRSP